MNQCCRSIYTLTSLRSYWVLLEQITASHHPLPLLNASEASVEELRRAVLISVAVSNTFSVDPELALLNHVKWRMFQFPEENYYGDKISDDAWIVLKNGIHFLQGTRDYLLLRDVSAGTIVSSIPFPGEIYCIRHLHYNGRIIVGSSYMLDTTA